MAALDEVHNGDIGTVFEATITDAGVVVDISTASVKDLNFKKPDDTTLNKAGAFTTDGTDGKLRYVTIAGDLDQSGKWSIQGHVTFGGGSWKTDLVEFVVAGNVL